MRAINAEGIKMGSYDTQEVSSGGYERPTPARERRTAVPKPIEESASSENTRRRVNTEYDPALKTIVALGGGLTPDRIVYPLTEDVVKGNLSEVVKYLTESSVATRSEDRAIVEAIRNRMEKADYRVIINQTMNKHNEVMGRDTIMEYLGHKEQDAEDGKIKFNFADIAIVSHDEGGRPLEYRL
jgi:hypothetical protein